MFKRIKLWIHDRIFSAHSAAGAIRRRLFTPRAEKEITENRAALMRERILRGYAK